MSSVCRVCLAGNTTMYSLTENQLIDVYEKLSNTKFNSEDARPRALCYNCNRKLLRCHAFSLMVHRSEELFNNLYNKDLEAGHEYNNEDKLEINQQYISIAAIPLISIDDNTTDAGSQVTIKDEPIPSIEIKEEIIIEHDNLVQVEFDPEHCTLSQLPLESDRENNVAELASNSHVEGTIPDDSKIISCNVCDKRFNRKSCLVRHMRTHTREKPFACTICGKEFSRISYVVNHVRIHTGEKPFACNICDKRFNQKNNLVNHMKIHSGEKSFSCNLCDKKFKQQKHLMDHMRIHTGEKPFECNVCNKRFNQKNILVKHMKIHSGEKSFSCNLCDKRFHQKHNLVAHMIMHTGVKSFSCNICVKQFYHKKDLVRHMRSHTL